MNMMLMDENWTVRLDEDGITIETVDGINIHEARELAVALDKIIKYVEGRE